MRIKIAFSIVSLLLPLAMAQTQRDRDMDGVPDAQDLCPQTPRGGLIVANGCSAVELARRPDGFVNRVLSGLNEVRAGLGQSLDTSQALENVTRAGDLIASAADQLRAGQVCEAASTETHANAALQLAQGQISAVVDTRTRLLLADRTLKGGDVERQEIEASFLKVWQAGANSAIDSALQWSRTVQLVCGNVQGPLAVRGFVTAKNESAHRITIDSGTYALAEVAFSQPLFTGQAISAVGTRFKDGTGIITSYTSPTAAPGPAPPPTKCIDLRVAPVQLLPPFGTGPITLHYPEAYGDGILLLEKDMGFAAGSLSCGLTPSVYSLKIEVQGAKTVTMASGLSVGDLPVTIPENIGGLLLIKVTQYATTCFLGGCSNPAQVDSYSFLAHLAERGSYSQAVYDRTIFEVADTGVSGYYQPAMVTTVTLNKVPASTNPIFVAQGYAVHNGQSSRPNLESIVVNAPFAIYEDDIYNPDALFDNLAEGVDKPSGLVWPHIAGTRNGRTFWYATVLPSLVRDRVSACSNSPDCYYRLPFAVGMTKQVGRGNFDDPVNAHGAGQAFAFDIFSNEGANLIAARGGRVVLVEERDWLNAANYPPGHPYFGNYLWIRHEDGTYAVYFHLQHNGGIAQYGDKVHRGDVIALTGNTGTSSDPHVHFEIFKCAGCPSAFPDPPSGQNYNTTSTKSRLRLNVWDPWTSVSTLKDCYIPRTGNFLQH